MASKHNTTPLTQYRAINYSTDRRQGRNDLCACGSGRKFKVCHMMRFIPVDPLRPALATVEGVSTTDAR